jgi:hypothetical protein
VEDTGHTDAVPAVETAYNLDHVGVVLVDRMKSSKLGGTAAENKRRNSFDTAGLSADMASLLAFPHTDMVVVPKSGETADLDLVTSEDRTELLVGSGIVVSNQATEPPAARCQTMLD